jgi:hypothetical protein
LRCATSRLRGGDLMWLGTPAIEVGGRADNVQAMVFCIVLR